MKQAIRALTQTLEERYTPEEMDMLEWFGDEETKDIYRWKFRFPKDGKIRIFTYVKPCKTVVIGRVN